MKKYILIDSKYRYKDFGNTSTNFMIFLPREINIKSYIKLSYLYMPRMNYLINPSNNSFKIVFANNTSYNVLLNNQNYSPVDLVQYINQQMNNVNNFNVSYNASTYKITFSANQNFYLDFNGSNFYKLLSLNKQTYDAIMINQNNYVFTSNCINFNTPKYIFLNIKNISNDVMMSCSPVKAADFIIPLLSTNFGDILKYTTNEYDIKMEVNYTCRLNFFEIAITDEDNIIFDNNNFDWFAIFEYV